MAVSESLERTALLSKSRGKTGDGLEEKLGRARARARLFGSEPQLPRVGGYDILEKLGEGGAGTVFAARNAETGREVALKIMRTVPRPEESSSSVQERGSAELLAQRGNKIARFKREFRALADVRHENLVQLYELGMADDDQLFFTMELLEGQGLMDHLRGDREPGKLPNLVRLRRVMRQLVAGISALHGKGWLHRDIKPSNVIVTTAGRVVVLDFGLLRDAGADVVDLTKEGELLGTPAYMAPEQASGQPSGRETDYYAVGTILFEALTGRRPFEGGVLKVIMDKRNAEEAPSPDRFADGIPARLSDMCQRLLSPARERRPTPEQILAALGGDYSPYIAQMDASAAEKHHLFVARDAELRVLERAYADLVTHRRGSTIHLRGPSGSGKSALIRRFSSTLDASQDPLVLRGRCFQRESVPYKGLDSIIDSLASELRRMPKVEAATALPRRIGVLAQAFPVLDTVELVARAPNPSFEVDGRELRSLAFAALREMFHRLSDRRTVVLCIDDFQWADLESAELLADLLRPPDPPALLLLLSYRDDVEGMGTVAMEHLEREQEREGSDVIDIELDPLSDEDARRLASSLWSSKHHAEPDPAALARWIEAAAGNPFNLEELVLGGPSEPSPTAIEGLVAQRVRSLPDSSRALLEMFSVAAGPLSPSIAFEALEARAGGQDLERLHESRMLRHPEDASGDGLEPEHDRIREAVVGEIHPDRLAQIHLALAEALEGQCEDAELLADHFEKAGQAARAAAYAARAARRAAQSLAFSRAVALAERALTMRSEDANVDELDELRELLAENLIAAGRGPEASEILLTLAERREGPAAIELKTRAADCQIKAGDVQGGLDVLEGLFKSMGMTLPRTRLGALKSFLTERTLLLFRRSVPPVSDVSDARRLARERADLCFAGVCGLATQEVMLGSYLESRHLRECLKSGDHYRIARAHAIHSLIEVQMGKPWSTASASHAKAVQLAAPYADPKLDGYVALCEGCAHWLEGRFGLAASIIDGAAETLDHAADAAWERAASYNFGAYARLMLGDYAELRGDLSRHVALARERGDIHELVELSSTQSRLLMYAGDVDGARRMLLESQEGWNPRPFRISHLWFLYATAPLDIYIGQPQEAAHAWEEAYASMKQVFLDRAVHVMRNARELHGRICVAAAAVDDVPGPYLDRAKKQAKLILASGNPLAIAQGNNILAGIASLRGERADAMRLWTLAAEAFDRQGIRGYAAAAHHRLASMRAGSDAAKHGDRARTFFATEGVGEPDRFASVLAPGRTESL